MTDVQRQMLDVLRAAMWGDKSSLTEDVDWNAVLEEMSKQAVDGMAADLLPREQGAKKAECLRGMCLFLNLIKVQSEAGEILDKSGIPYVVLKGTSAAVYYPKPQYRCMGDIDILIAPEQIQKAIEALSGNGFALSDVNPTERHRTLMKNGVSLEMHDRFTLEEENARRGGLDRHLTESILRRETKTVCGHAFPTLPPAENGLVFASHIAHHMMNEGIGLRQILDFILFSAAEITDEAWTREYAALFERYGLRKIASVVSRMGQLYLGWHPERNWCREADDALCLDLLEDVLDNGNFGRSRDSYREMTFTVMHMSVSEKFKYLRHMQERGEENWEALKTKPWLKPLAWAYQFRLNLEHRCKRSTKADLSGDSEVLRRRKALAKLFRT